MLGTGRETIPRHFINLTHALVIGNPGKIVGWVDQEGNRLDFNQKGICTCGQFQLKNNILTRK